MEVHHKNAEPWEVTLVDTGDASMTGGRLKRVREYVNNETFCFTYGDGVADIDVTALIAHHKAHGRLGTVTAVQPPGRYGALQFGENGSVIGFQEKPQGLLRRGPVVRVAAPELVRQPLFVERYYIIQRAGALAGETGARGGVARVSGSVVRRPGLGGPDAGRGAVAGALRLGPALRRVFGEHAFIYAARRQVARGAGVGARREGVGAGVVRVVHRSIQSSEPPTVC